MNQQLRVFVSLLEALYSVLRTHVATNTIWKSRSESDTLLQPLCAQGKHGSHI